MENEFIVKYVPMLIPFIGVIVLIMLIKKQLLSGVVSTDLMERIFAIEKGHLEFQTKFEEKLLKIVGDIGSTTKTAQQVKADIEELKHLMYEHNTQTRDLLAGLRKRQDDFLQGMADNHNEPAR